MHSRQGATWPAARASAVRETLTSTPRQRASNRGKPRYDGHGGDGNAT
jgi:hypothetical protein